VRNDVIVVGMRGELDNAAGVLAKAHFVPDHQHNFKGDDDVSDT